MLDAIFIVYETSNANTAWALCMGICCASTSWHFLKTIASPLFKWALRVYERTYAALNGIERCLATLDLCVLLRHGRLQRAAH